LGIGIGVGIGFRLRFGCLLCHFLRRRLRSRLRSHVRLDRGIFRHCRLFDHFGWAGRFVGPGFGILARRFLAAKLLLLAFGIFSLALFTTFLQLALSFLALLQRFGIIGDGAALDIGALAAHFDIHGLRGGATAASRRYLEFAALTPAQSDLARPCASGRSLVAL